MDRRIWALAFACLTLAAALLLSACGSSSSSSSSAATDTESTTTEGESSGGSGSEGEASGAPIKVGLIAGLTGPFAANTGQVGNVAEAWAEAVNAEGGINGSPVKVIVKDDGGDPSKASVVARELKDEGIVALAGSWDVTAGIYEPYLTEQKIPDIGGSPSDFNTENGDPNFFPSGGNEIGFIYGILANAKEAGNSKMAVFYCAEYPNCKTLATSMETMAKNIGGIEVAEKLNIAASEPSYTAQCLQAKQSGADSMYVNDAGPTLPNAITDCQHQGFEVPQYNNINDTNGEFFENPVSEGMSLTLPNPPAADTSTPGGKYMNETLEKYAPGIQGEKNWNEAMAITWSGLQLFRKAAELGHVTASSTSEDVYDGLYKIKNYTIEGLSPPLTFTKGKATTVYCWFSGEIKEGTAVSESLEPACIPNDQVEGIVKAVEG